MKTAFMLLVSMTSLIQIRAMEVITFTSQNEKEYKISVKLNYSCEHGSTKSYYIPICKQSFSPAELLQIETVLKDCASRTHPFDVPFESTVSKQSDNFKRLNVAKKSAAWNKFQGIKKNLEERISHLEKTHTALQQSCNQSFFESFLRAAVDAYGNTVGLYGIVNSNIQCPANEYKPHLVITSEESTKIFSKRPELIAVAFVIASINNKTINSTIINEFPFLNTSKY